MRKTFTAKTQRREERKEIMARCKQQKTNALDFLCGPLRTSRLCTSFGRLCGEKNFPSLMTLSLDRLPYCRGAA
jgi:hypothetical protein